MSSNRFGKWERFPKWGSTAVEARANFEDAIRDYAARVGGRVWSHDQVTALGAAIIGDKHLSNMLSIWSKTNDGEIRDEIVKGGDLSDAFRQVDAEFGPAPQSELPPGGDDDKKHTVDLDPKTGDIDMSNATNTTAAGGTNTTNTTNTTNPTNTTNTTNTTAGGNDAPPPIEFTRQMALRVIKVVMPRNQGDISSQLVDQVRAAIQAHGGDYFEQWALDFTNDHEHAGVARLVKKNLVRTLETASPISDQSPHYYPRTTDQPNPKITPAGLQSFLTSGEYPLPGSASVPAGSGTDDQKDKDATIPVPTPADTAFAQGKTPQGQPANVGVERPGVRTLTTGEQQLTRPGKSFNVGGGRIQAEFVPDEEKGDVQVAGPIAVSVANPVLRAQFDVAGADEVRPEPIDNVQNDYLFETWSWVPDSGADGLGSRNQLKRLNRQVDQIRFGPSDLPAPRDFDTGVHEDCPHVPMHSAMGPSSDMGSGVVDMIVERFATKPAEAAAEVAADRIVDRFSIWGDTRSQLSAKALPGSDRRHTNLQSIYGPLRPRRGYLSRRAFPQSTRRVPARPNLPYTAGLPVVVEN